MIILEKLIEHHQIKAYIKENYNNSLNLVNDNLNINKLSNYIESNLNLFIVEGDSISTYNNIKDFALFYLSENIFYKTGNGIVSGLKNTIYGGVNYSPVVGPTAYALNSGDAIKVNTISAISGMADMGLGSKMGTLKNLISPAAWTAGAVELTSSVSAVTGGVLGGAIMSAGFTGYSIGDIGNHIPIFRDKIYPFIQRDVGEGGLGMMWNVDKLVKSYQWADNKTQQGAIGIWNFLSNAFVSDRTAHVNHNVSQLTNTSASTHPLALVGKIANLSNQVLDSSRTGNYEKVLPTFQKYKDMIPKQFADSMKNRFQEKIPEIEKSEFQKVIDFANEYPKYYVPIIILGMCGLIFKLKSRKFK